MKIYDCFLFFNELDLLDVRLNELDPYVDYFVLVEARESFQGKAKPLFFEENKNRYSKFLDKIIHVIVDTDPSLTAWPRQHYHRKSISRGLVNCQSEDVIIISDLDEIPKGSILRNNLPKPGKPTELILHTYSHFLNRRLLRKDPKYKDLGGEDWNGSVLVRYADFSNAEHVRRLEGNFKDCRSSGNLQVVQNAGWHFSWMGDFEHISYKAESLSGSTALNSVVKNQSAWNKQISRIREGTELEGHIPTKKVEYRFEEIGESYPKYILENLSQFDSWIYRKK